LVFTVSLLNVQHFRFERVSRLVQSVEIGREVCLLCP